MMEKMKSVVCETRKKEGEAKVRTNLTLDFSGLTEEDIFEMAVDSAVIKWQNSARRNALKGEDAIPIPTSATYIVPKPGSRASGAVSERAALIKMVGSEEKADALIARANGDVHSVVEKLREVLETL